MIRSFPKSAILLTSAIVFVVVGFAGAMWAAQRPLHGVGVRAGEISRNAVPSIEELSTARTALTELAGDAMQLAASLDAAANADARARLERARRELDSAIGRYLAMPVSPEERQRLGSLPGEMHALDEAVAELTGQGGAGSDRRSRIRDFMPHIEVLDRTLADLVKLNATIATREAGAIARAWETSTRIAQVLGVISFAGAVIATLLAVRALLANETLAAKHGQLLHDRASELDAFAGRVAHDLRNPLSALSLRVARLQASTGGSADRAVVDQIRSQIERMAVIIEALLEFARAGARPSPDHRANVASVVAEVVASEREVAAAQRIDVVVDTEDAEVRCAPGALTSVVGNLIRNAVKYVVEGPAERPRVTIRARRIEPDLIRLEVEDTGPGVPLSDQERIFEPFIRSETRQPGIGLGLATVKRIVEAYGGRVGVVAPQDGGSCFWCELPANRPTPDPPGTAAA